ncbi:MAG: tetratricopeptide repeat protein [Candidatus Hydrogenedentes bacterium]|nr:tetratricopeptide repeat protein [Candidatus Hydrogenedentota bacterium]
MSIFSHGRLPRVMLSCVLISGLMLIGCGNRSEQYSDLGMTYLRIGKIKEAEAEFQKALNANEGNALAMLGMARVHRARGDDGRALEQYAKAIETDSSLEEAYAESSDLLVRLNRLSDAEELAGRLSDQDALAGGLLKASIYRASGRIEEAIAVLDELISAHPGNLDVQMNKARTYLAARRPAEAEKVLDDLIAKQDDSLAARMMLVEVYQVQGRLPEMAAQLEDLVATNPEKPELALLLARTMLASNRLDEAEDIARPIVESDPEDGWANFVLGGVLAARGNASEAMPYLQAATQALPEEPAVQLAIAHVQSMADGRSTTAGGDATRQGGKQEATWQHLWRSAQLGKLLEGEREFLATNEPNVRETFVMAALLIGRPKKAFELAQSLPEESPFRAYLTALESGEMQQVIDMLDGWEESSSDRRILQQNAQGFANAYIGRRGVALREFAQALKTWPDSGVAYYNLGMMYLRAGMPQFATRVLGRLTALYPENIEAHELRFRALIEAGMESEARTLAESAHALFPRDPRVLVNLAQIYMNEGKIDLAASVLKQGVSTVQDDEGLKVAYADVLLHAGDLRSAVRELDNARVPKSFESRAALIRGFAAAEAGDWPAVAKAAGDVTPEQKSLSVRLLECAALIHQGKQSQALSALKVEDAFAGGAMARAGVLIAALGGPADGLDADETALANALAQNQNLMGDFAFALASREARLFSVAVETFTRLEEALPQQPSLVWTMLDTLAYAGEEGGRVARAKQYTQRYPDMAKAFLGLANIYHELENPYEEQEALEEAARIAPSEPAVLQQLASFYDRQSDLNSARGIYEKLVQLRPNDPLVNNNLAYAILETGGDAEQAYRYAQAAMDGLGKNLNGQILHTFGLAQLRRGDLEQAERVLSVALEMRPGDPTLMLDFAQVLMKRGQTAEGRRIIEQAITFADQLNLDFPRRSEAEDALAAT